LPCFFIIRALKGSLHDFVGIDLACESITTMTDKQQDAPKQKPTWSTPKLELLVNLDEAESVKVANPDEFTTGSDVSYGPS